MDGTPMTDEQIAEAAVFTPDEIAFINRVARSAFKREDRPYVLVAICAAILANVIDQSAGALDEEGMLKWLKMAMHPDNLDPKP